MSNKSDWYVVDYRTGAVVDGTPHHSQTEASNAANAISTRMPDRMLAVRQFTK